jgi:uncharacterized protein YqgV (UPF0045/DUF77 family)
MRVRAELSIYPFREGETPPQQVEAAMDELRKAGVEVSLELLGVVAVGDSDRVMDGLRAAIPAALEKGGRRVALSVEVAE